MRESTRVTSLWTARLLAAASFAGSFVVAGCGTTHSRPIVTAPDGGTPVIDNCVDGTKRCKDLTWQTCKNLTWTDTKVCAANCDVALGCTQCPPNGTLCDGANVYGCDAMGNKGAFRTMCKDACVGGTCTDPCGMAAAELSYLGCDYFPTVTVNSGLIVESHFAIAIANPQSDDVDVNITRNGKMIGSQTIKSGDLATIKLPWVMELKDATTSVQIPGGAYKLTSSEPVTVYQFNPIEFQVATCIDPRTQMQMAPCYTYTNDASLLLPASTLTGHYIAIARESFMLKETIQGFFTQFVHYPGFISIVGVEDVTATVNVKFTANTIASMTGSPQAFRAGATGVFKLKQGDVLQLLSDSPMTCNAVGMDMGANQTVFGYCDLPNTDLTGTEITADHKLAVFSGHDCTFIPYNRWACDHLEQEMLPLESWGKDYLASHSSRVPITIPDFWRVVSGDDGNAITFDPPSVHAPIMLNRGEWVEFSSMADFEAIGDKAFQLVQYMTGEDYAGFGTGGNPASHPGDPAMSLSVPIEQYRKQYTFLTPDTYTVNYVNIAAPANTTITLDGKPVDASQFKAFGAGKYSVARVKVMAGPHTIAGSDYFGIAVYGLAPYTSYMFPGGLDVKMINVQ